VIWIAVKYTPKRIANNNPIHLSLKFILIIVCDYVIVNPEKIKIIIFNKGISYGLKGIIPLRGDNCPISISGDKDMEVCSKKRYKK